MQNQIPNNRQNSTLADITIKVTDGSHYSPKEKIDGRYKIATVKDLTDYGFDIKSCKNISEEDFNKLVASDCLPKKDDVLLSKDGTMGLVYLQEKDSEIPVLSSIAIIRPDKNLINPQYLKYFLKWKETQRFLTEGLSSGSALPRIILKDLKKLPISYPHIYIQQQIGNFLKAFDDKIETNNKIAKTLKETAQKLFREWFFGNEGEKYSLLGAAQFINGGAFGKIVNKAKAGLPLIKIADLNRGISENTEWIDKKIDDKYYINNGDLLFSWSGTVDLFIWDKGDAILNQHIFNVVPMNGFAKGFLYFFIDSKLRFFKQQAGAKATTMGHIKKEHLREQTIFIPLDNNLGIFDVIYKKIVNLKLENQKLALLRDLILPKLMKGEIGI